MKIPTKIKVAGHSVAIKQSKVFTKNPSLLGLAYMPGNKIDLFTTFEKEELPETTKSEIFLHEILHQVSDKYAIRLRENQVKQLAGGLFQVIRDNKLNFLDTQEY